MNGREETPEQSYEPLTLKEASRSLDQLQEIIAAGQVDQLQEFLHHHRNRAAILFSQNIELEVFLLQLETFGLLDNVHKFIIADSIKRGFLTRNAGLLNEASAQFADTTFTIEDLNFFLFISDQSARMSIAQEGSSISVDFQEAIIRLNDIQNKKHAYLTNIWERPSYPLSNRAPRGSALYEEEQLAEALRRSMQLQPEEKEKESDETKSSAADNEPLTRLRMLAANSPLIRRESDEEDPDLMRAKALSLQMDVGEKELYGRPGSPLLFDAANRQRTQTRNNDAVLEGCQTSDPSITKNTRN